MKILGRRSSINVRKVLWTGAELGLQFEHDPAWGTDEKSTRRPEFLNLNPNGLVPVLIDNEGVLWESNTICRYLVARLRRWDLLPAEPRGRALVERWMDWSAGDLNRAWSYSFMALTRRDPSFGSDLEVARSVEAWNKLMLVLDGHLAASGHYACGENFTLADVTLGLAVHRWRQTPLPHRPLLRNVDRYFRLLEERSLFQGYATNELP